jgi:hypothetical protein
MARLFRILVPAGSLMLPVSEILLVTAAFVLATYFELKVDPTVFLLYDGGLERIALFLLCLLMGMRLRGLYTRIRVQSRLALLQQLCMVFGFAILIQGLAGFFAPGLRLPLPVMLLGSGMALAAIFAWRILFSARARQMAGQGPLPSNPGEPGSGGDRRQPLVSGAPAHGAGGDAVLVRPDVVPADSDRV